MKSSSQWEGRGAAMGPTPVDDPSLWHIGLGTGQDLCADGSHLGRIAEVQPNDPSPRARRHHLTLQAGVLVPGFQ